MISPEQIAAGLAAWGYRVRLCSQLPGYEAHPVRVVLVDGHARHERPIGLPRYNVGIDAPSGTCSLNRWDGERFVCLLRGARPLEICLMLQAGGVSGPPKTSTFWPLAGLFPGVQ